MFGGVQIHGYSGCPIEGCLFTNKWTTLSDGAHLLVVGSLAYLEAIGKPCDPGHPEANMSSCSSDNKTLDEATHPLAERFHQTTPRLGSQVNWLPLAMHRKMQRITKTECP